MQCIGRVGYRLLVTLGVQLRGILTPTSRCRSTLQAVNVVLAVTGLSMLGYAAYMYIDYEHITFSTDQSSYTHPRLLEWVIQAHRHGSPW